VGLLTGKVAVVTGASTGIGRAAAIALAAQQAAVVLADVDAARGEQTAADINETGGQAHFVRTDVANDDDVATMVAQAVERFGGVDLAFNNAGIEGTPAITHECTPDTWNSTLAVILTGIWSCMRHEIPRMLERGGGSIVNCSSVAGLVGLATLPAYSAAKHGVIGLTKTAALEYHAHGIRVNAVCPGAIDTEMLARIHERIAQNQAAPPPPPEGERVLGRPDEIADAVVWLCSSQSSFVTGQAIAIDGGFVAR